MKIAYFPGFSGITVLIQALIQFLTPLLSQIRMTNRAREPHNNER